jgi:hypothetical protein
MAKARTLEAKSEQQSRTEPPADSAFTELFRVQGKGALPLVTFCCYGVPARAYPAAIR